jgi:octaprenyl-diphosphate synthase
MIELIRKPVEKEFGAYESAFESAIHTDNYLLGKILAYVRKSKGKELRPILTLLSASLFNNLNDDTIVAAVSLELLHTASLMHDDVVDQTFERRSRFSVNALWNNRVAILVGDYYLSKAAYITRQVKTRRITSLLSKLGCDLSDGELMQVSNEQRLMIDEAAYLDVIRKKTAVTFAFCTQAGAITAEASEEDEETLRLFGEYLGMVFQIKDDIFDYFETSDIGKPTGNDLKEGKMTLPLIYSLEHAPKDEVRKFKNMIRNRDYTTDNLRDMSEFVQKNMGIVYAEKRMNDFKEKAIECLSAFPDSEYKNALIQCLYYAMNRKK